MVVVKVVVMTVVKGEASANLSHTVNWWCHLVSCFCLAQGTLSLPPVFQGLFFSSGYPFFFFISSFLKIMKYFKSTEKFKIYYYLFSIITL